MNEPPAALQDNGYEIAIKSFLLWAKVSKIMSGFCFQIIIKSRLPALQVHCASTYYKYRKTRVRQN